VLRAATTADVPALPAIELAAGERFRTVDLDAIADDDPVAIVEGEIDALTIRASGGPPCVSVPDGAPAITASNYASKFAFLDVRALRLLRSAATILIGTDMDAPGCKLADELARRIGAARCKRVSWPDGCKDANETLTQLGAMAVLGALSGARPFPEGVADSPPHGMRSVRVVPPARGRRPLIDLTVREARHAH
jgi:hypothetical protein